MGPDCTEMWTVNTNIYATLRSAHICKRAKTKRGYRCHKSTVIRLDSGWPWNRLSTRSASKINRENRRLRDLIRRESARPYIQYLKENPGIYASLRDQGKVVLNCYISKVISAQRTQIQGTASTTSVVKSSKRQGIIKPLTFYLQYLGSSCFTMSQ